MLIDSAVGESFFFNILDAFAFAQFHPISPSDAPWDQQTIAFP